MGSIRIGCSAWNYRDWRERVYPRGLPARRWLAHYATLFDTVEVNLADGIGRFYEAIGDHPARPWQPWIRTTDWGLVRFHYGHRGRRGNYSDAELRELAGRVTALAEEGDLYVYFDNDWEAFAVRNALRLRELVRSPAIGRP